MQWVEGAKEAIHRLKVERKRKADTATEKAADKASKLAKDEQVRHSLRHPSVANMYRVAHMPVDIVTNSRTIA